MGGHGDDRQGGPELDAGGHVGERRPEHLAGVDRRGEQLRAQPEGPGHPVDDLAGTHVDQLGRRSVGALEAALPGEEISEEVGHHQELGGTGVGGALTLGHELVKRVYLHLLDTGGLVDTALPDHLVGRPDVTRRPLVPVVERLA